MKCNECKKEFETYKELTKHLIREHSYDMNRLLKYYECSVEGGEICCPICGNKFKATNDQIKKLKNGKVKTITCCRSCSSTIQSFLFGSPLAKKEVRDKCNDTIKNKYGVENISQLNEIKEKKKQTLLKNYGVDAVSRIPELKEQAHEKMKKTNLKNLGVEYPAQSSEVMQRMKRTNLERYGAEYIVKVPKFQEKAERTNLERYGVKNAFQNKEVQNKAKRTNLRKYGKEHASQSEEIKGRIKEATLEKYGVEYFCQHERCYTKSARISKVNKEFQEFLLSEGIQSELEYIIENQGFDLKVNNILIELNPSVTHNSTWGPRFGSKIKEAKPHDYHLGKTLLAKKYGFQCIHIFDWDNKEKVISLLKMKEARYARKGVVKEISRREADDFLGEYHLQGSTKQIKYAYGLFYEGELLQVMTFGKPRYNKNYEYELLRLCTVPGVSVVGGAKKILHYFEEKVNPKSIISYCDISKFNGEIYEKLGFTLADKTSPTRHWYNPKTKRHITDNLLRQQGFDRLHGANFGKGTSNEELMREYGYVEIYDCGQLVFVKVL